MAPRLKGLRRGGVKAGELEIKNFTLDELNSLEIQVEIPSWQLNM